MAGINWDNLTSALNKLDIYFNDETGKIDEGMDALEEGEASNELQARMLKLQTFYTTTATTIIGAFSEVGDAAKTVANKAS